MIYHGDNDRDLTDLADTVRHTTADLRPYRGEFDAIAVTGTSGLLVGPTVALRLRKALVVVRKENDGSHTSHRRGKLRLHPGLEDLNKRSANRRRVLFLDDFVMSGATRRRVQEVVQKAGALVVAQYTYGDTVPTFRTVP